MASTSDDEKRSSISEAQNRPHAAQNSSTSPSADGDAKPEKEPVLGDHAEDAAENADAGDESQYERSRAKVAVIMLALGVSLE